MKNKVNRAFTAKKKSFFYAMFLACVSLMMGSCAFVKGDAEVILSVDDPSSNRHIGEKVYMYYTQTSSVQMEDPKKADEVKEIDQDGYARFTLSSALFLIEETRTFYFEMFDESGQVIARKGLSLTAGSKTLDYLTINEIQ